MTPEPRPVTRKDVLAFENHCVRLCGSWVHYQTLFNGSDLKRELLKTTAETFFGDLNLKLIEHLILQVCKLTDPESTAGKRNLTVEFLMRNADFSASRRKLSKLKKIAARMDAFRKRILPARNKRISHFDLDTAHARKSLGGASIEAWQRFWRDLEAFVAIMHETYVDPRHPFLLTQVGRSSDADQLVKAMKESTYFRTLLNDDALAGKVANVAFQSKYHEA
jgi:AbiU2